MSEPINGNPQLSGACADCGRRYGDEYGFPDLVIPDWAWEKISPRSGHGGLLCPSCICRRLHERGIECEGRFMSGPLYRRERCTLYANCGGTKGHDGACFRAEQPLDRKVTDEEWARMLDPPEEG